MAKTTKVEIRLLTNQIESRRRAGFVVTIQPQIVEVTDEQLKALNGDSFIGVSIPASEAPAEKPEVPSTETQTEEETGDTSDEDTSGSESADDEESDGDADDSEEDEDTDTDDGESDPEKPEVPSKSTLLRNNSLDQMKELAKSHGIEVADDATKPKLADAIIEKLSK